MPPGPASREHLLSVDGLTPHGVLPPLHVLRVFEQLVHLAAIGRDPRDRCRGGAPGDAADGNDAVAEAVSLLKHYARRSVNRNREPLPRVLSTSMVPPCASIRPRAIASPSPAVGVPSPR
jgi:hypothetical protein